MRRRIAVLTIAALSLLSVLPAGASSMGETDTDVTDSHICVRSKPLFGQGRGICVDW